MISNTVDNPLPETSFVFVSSAEVDPIHNLDDTPLAETTLSLTVTALQYEVEPVASPERSSAKVAVLGDRTGGYDSTRASTVDTAIMSVAADTLNVLSIGDVADTTNAYTINDTLKTEILSRGGKIYPTVGNHDYDGSRETEFDDYFDINGYNGGKYYYSVVLGHVEFFVYNDNPEDTDNGGGFSATQAANQASTMGQWLLAAIAASTAPWKIFVTHHPGYSDSASGTGWAAQRWDWDGLGVHAVIQGHLHGLERIYKDGVYWLTCAMGGGNHFNWTTISADTVWREENTAISGYLKINDSETAIQFEYYDTSNNLLDASRIERTATPDPPVITSDLVAQSVSSGGSLTLSVTATGADSFAWFKGPDLIPGETGSSLTLADFAAEDAATYRVRALNGGGYDSSSAAITLSEGAAGGTEESLFAVVAFAEGNALAPGVYAVASVSPVIAEGGRGGRAQVTGVSARSAGPQGVRAEGITNPSTEELEALLLMID